jgi:hypothetical protein
MATIDDILLWLLIFNTFFNISMARRFDKLITGLYDEDEKPKKQSK